MNASRGGGLIALAGLIAIADVACQRPAVEGRGRAEAPTPGPAATQPFERSRERLEPSRESRSLRHDTTSATVDPQGRTALDGMDLADIVAFRRARVAEQAGLGLFPSSYDPMEGASRRIWGSITPRAKWLGPTAYYVANPYVLIVIVCANHVTPLNLFCPEVAFRYGHRRIEEAHAGASARCWLDHAFTPPYTDRPGQLRVVMVNAYDAGFRYAHVDLGQSHNLGPDPSPGNVVNGLFEQSSFFHVGKYQANNISPEDPNGWIRVLDSGLATKIHVKLWTSRPTSPTAEAEMTYVIEVRPQG